MINLCHFLLYIFLATYIILIQELNLLAYIFKLGINWMHCHYLFLLLTFTTFTILLLVYNIKRFVSMNVVWLLTKYLLRAFPAGLIPPKNKKMWGSNTFLFINLQFQIHFRKASLRCRPQSTILGLSTDCSFYLLKVWSVW